MILDIAMMIVTSPRSSWTAFITSIDLDFTILLAPVVAWKPVFKSIFFQVASYSRCKVHSKIILPSPEWPRTKNKNINTSVGASDYWTLSAQSANLERFASNSFCPLKFSFALEDRPKDHFRNCNAQNTSPVQLDWQHYWAPAPGGEAEKAGWSSPPCPRSPTRLRRQLLPEVQQWNYPGACFMGGATTFPSSTCPCPVSWFSVSVCSPAAGCSTTGSSEPAASAILSAEWLWNRIQSVIKGTAQEELSWRGMAF